GARRVVADAIVLHEDRCFDPDPAIRRVARTLYDETRRLPIIAPHGHVDPRMLAGNEPFAEPAALIVQPDHYILRLLYARGAPLVDYAEFVHALEDRRAFFKRMGSTATDHAVLEPHTTWLPPDEAEVLFQQARQGEATRADERRFEAHLLLEMARMSLDDGLVMQLHPGAFRNHNQMLFERFGPDRGGDIPVATEFTRSLRPLLTAYGNDP